MTAINQTYDPEMPVEWIRPNPLNPNEGDEASLVESIDEHGFVGAIMVRQVDEYEYELIGGEHRWKDRVARGIATIPAIILHDVDDVKALKLLLADNEVTRRGQNNTAKLNLVLRKLPDLRATGFPPDIAAQLEQHETERKKNAVPDVPEAKEFPHEYAIIIHCDDEESQEKLYNQIAERLDVDLTRVRAASI